MEQVGLLARQYCYVEGMGGIRGAEDLVHNVVGVDEVSVVPADLGNGGRDN